MKSFPEQLLAARKASGLTQEQLAEQMNVSRPMISHWETGRSLPDLETVKRLSQLLEYNFLQEGEQEFAVQPEIFAAPEDNFPRKKRIRIALLGFLAGVVVATVAALFVFLPMRPQSTAAQSLDQRVYAPFVEGDGAPEWFMRPNERVEGQAYLVATSPENPLKAILSPDLEKGILWPYQVLLEEQNGIDFTVETYMVAMFYSDDAVLIERFAGDELLSIWGLDTIVGNGRFMATGEIPRQPLVGIGFLFVGVDANGNELSFHYYLQLSQELKQTTAAQQTQDPASPAVESAAAKLLAWYKQPSERVEGQAYVEISSDENPLKAVRSDIFTSGVGWRHTFVIQETNGIDFIVEEAKISNFISESKEVTYTYDASEVGQWWNRNVIVGNGGKYYLDGDRPFQDLYGIGITLSGVDVNGNAGEFHYFLKLSQEIAE